MQSQFVMLAHKFDPLKHSVAGWMVSEKLDGMRCIWDGGASRGKLCSEVPYANVEKDDRYVNQPVATGLWSRYGKVIVAPDWFLDGLPVGLCLDGELYAGLNEFQFVMSTVKKLSPDDVAWNRIKYYVFDMPPAPALFGDRIVNITNLKINLYGAYSWWVRNVKTISKMATSFERAYQYLLTLTFPDWVKIHNQEFLPFNTSLAMSEIRDKLDLVCDAGGEGLMLRRGSSVWHPVRSYDLLKVKKLHDMEGFVIGYKWGRETDKGSKLLGLMGALTLRLASGVVFDLSGFSEAERVMTVRDESCPGTVVDDSVSSVLFPRGALVTFRYRELTDSGVPKEARFLRIK